MRTVLEVVALLLAAASMSLTLAHALELPGKMRLGRDDYLVAERIYYPGFTIGGVCEPLTILAIAALLAMTPLGTAFALLAVALIAALAAHVIYWLVTAPVNTSWLQGEALAPTARRFFGEGPGPDADWTVLRDRWERSHVARAITATIAFCLLATAATIAS